MKKKLLFILLLLLFVFMGYSQDKNAIDSTSAPAFRPIVEPEDPGEPGDPGPTNYQWNRDGDGDGYGDPADYVFSPTKPRGYVSNQADCDDTTAAIKSSSEVWYRDVDKDGYGGKSGTTTGCFPPVGYAYTNDDIDDSNPNITYITPKYFYNDYDRDGFGNPNSKIFYSVRPDGWVIDNTDCDDYDDTIKPNTSWYRDTDGDGYGSAAVIIKSCYPVTGYVRSSDDLDDANGNITNITPQVYYYDNDGDGYGNPAISAYYSVKPTNWVLYNNDCNDNDVLIHPGNYWFYDGDHDGYGQKGTLIASCTPIVGYVRNDYDYDDANVNITSGPPRLYYYDGDGDGDGDPNVSKYYSYGALNWTTSNYDCNDNDASLYRYTRWYPDEDGDGYGSMINVIIGCTQPSGYIRSYGDYNDNNVNITNIAPQYFYPDADGDTYGNKNSNLALYYSVKPEGYVTNNEDFLDTDVYITNIAPHDVYRDADGDGFGTYNAIHGASISRPGYVDNRQDFDDTTPYITNITPQRFYQDTDGDTFGNPLVSLYYSAKPSGYVDNKLDCNDIDASLNPNTKWFEDADLDGLGNPLIYIQQCAVPIGNYVSNSSDNCPLIVGTNADCSTIIAPSADHNYIITKNYKQPTTEVIESPQANQMQTNITYFDGLGRPVQQIANRQSCSGNDIITHIGYDDFGRQREEYLPFKSETGSMAYDENAKANTINFYTKEQYDNTANPFSQKQLESSPLSRVIKQAAPGTSWAMGGGHEIKLEYQTNTSDEVKLYHATATWDSGLGLYEITFSDQGNYAEKQLYKNITFDENSGANPSESGGATVEFKNKEGQVILKRTYEAGSKHDTYYVYDNYGNLTYVIPPKADGAINDEVLNGLCYQYKYDYRNRLAEKKLPGKQWEFIVYDKLDRPVATGPVFSPFKDDGSTGWIITKYDVFGRPIYTGWSSQAVSSVARSSLQNAQNTASILFETKASQTIDGVATAYENAIAPTSFKLLTVNYYDDYTFPEAQAVPSTVMTQPVLANVKGLATGSWTRALTTASSIAGETATIFYDKKGRVISTYVKNHLTGTSHTDNEIDFTGKVLNTATEHQRVSGEAKITVKEHFTYSVQDRLLTHTHQIGGGAEELLAENTYDELGQLIGKKVGNSTGAPLQKVDFNYNIRGWLTEINKTDELQQGSDPVDLFAFKINYNKRQTEIPNVKELYNGNIAEIFWKTASDNLERSYGYQYDKLNRLTDAIYQKSKMTTDSYNENLSYDKNGNIISLNRNGDMDPQAGTNVIDKLTYTYPANSNQLFKVVDDSFNSSGFDDANLTGDDYGYDNNGNMISDKNKNITDIKYNHLNLPKKIIFGTGNTIEYIYNAAGQKLEKIVNENNVSATTNYLEGFQYKDNVLEFFPTAEGYVKNDAGALSYVFQYKDHLGNIRLNFAKNPATQVLEIIEENNYYPFGLKHKGYNNYVAINNKYKYNGKELQDELGLNMYDYGARNYDPALGRWMNIDPLAEKYNSWSGYNYALNNPVLFIDPDGREINISELMRSKSHAQAFIAFAKTKQGINFLNKYASAGQKLEYGGKVFYQAGKKAGEYDKKGIDINYGFSTSNTASHTGTDITKDGFVINVDIAREGFGSENKVYNLAKSIVHESLLHAELDAKDVSDGMPDNSSVPSEYRKYDNPSEANAQHYYVGREYFSGSKSTDAQYFPTEGFNASKAISKSLNLNYSDTKIKTIQWQFGGSLIQVDQKTGKTSYKK